MLLSRSIRPYRSLAILAILVLLCLISLATGTQATLLSTALRTTVATVSHPFWAGLTSVQRGASYVSGLVFTYNAAQKENAALLYQLEMSMVQSSAYEELIAENDRLRDLLAYQRDERRFSMLAARVLGGQEGALIVNRGSVHGVREYSCVVTKDGIVGYVAEVYPFNSVVYTLHHAQCKVGAMIKSTRVKGMIMGSGSQGNTICMMQSIDTKDTVRTGEEVVTSEESRFPTGLPIGVVKAIDSDTGSLWKTAYIEPFADPYAVDDLLLIIEAQSEADEFTAVDAAPSVVAPEADAVVDAETMQERYAP